MAVLIIVHLQTTECSDFYRVQVKKTLLMHCVSYSCRKLSVFQQTKLLRSLENANKPQWSNLLDVFKYPYVPICEQLPKVPSWLEYNLRFLCLALKIVAKMQRFGFYMSSGSLIGLQDIYKYYGSDPVDENEFPSCYPTETNDPELLPEQGVGEGNLVPNGWIPYPEVEKMSLDIRTRSLLH